MAPVLQLGAVPIAIFKLIVEGKVPLFGNNIEVYGLPKV